jgi:hypothetical protein
MSAAASARREDNIAKIPNYIGTDESGLVVGTGVDSSRLLSRFVEVLRNREHVRDNLDGLNSYSRIETQLRRLLSQPEHDDFGRIRPSREAVRITKKTLFQLAIEGSSIPMPEDVDTDREGAIRIAWTHGERSLELVVPYELTEQPYLYHSQGQKYGIDEDFSSDALSRWLAWLDD